MNKSIKNALLLGAVVAMSGSVWSAAPAQYSRADVHSDPEAFKMRRSQSMARIQALLNDPALDTKEKVEVKRKEALKARRGEIDKARAAGLADFIAGKEDVPALTANTYYTLKSGAAGTKKDDYEPVASWDDAFKNKGRLYTLGKNATTNKFEASPADLDVTAKYEDGLAQYGKDGDEYASRWNLDLKGFKNRHVWKLSDAIASDPDLKGAAAFYQKNKKSAAPDLDDSEDSKKTLESMVALSKKVEFNGSLEENVDKAFATDEDAALDLLGSILKPRGLAVVTTTAFDVLVALTHDAPANGVDKLLSLTGKSKASWEAALRAEFGGGTAASGTGSTTPITPPPPLTTPGSHKQLPAGATVRNGIVYDKNDDKIGLQSEYE